MHLCVCAKVPVAVQELGVASCSVEAAVTSCFHQVRMKQLSESGPVLVLVMVQVFTSPEAVVPPGELPDSESQAGDVMVGGGAPSVAMVICSLSPLAQPPPPPRRPLPLLQDPPPHWP